MPHIIVKLFPGRSEEQKLKLADEIVKDVVAIANCAEKSVSVAFEEIEEKDWVEKVYQDTYSRSRFRRHQPDIRPCERMFSRCGRAVWSHAGKLSQTPIALHRRVD